MAKPIGIDLGTTNSLGAIKRINVEVLPNSDNEDLTRSCVAKRDGKILVGKNAFDLLKSDPENTILSIKRLMGRGIQDPEVQKIIKEKRFAYKVQKLSTGTEDSIAVMLGNAEYTPEQISAEILKKIKKDAEARLNDQVEHAVITVPAYFNNKQKHATRIAAYLAGIKVQQILPEPTAAAISFGFDEQAGEEPQYILVFDFGGGTLDISILTFCRKSNGGVDFIEQGKSGDMWLGGDDVDQLLINYIYSKIEKQYQIKNLNNLIEKMDSNTRSLFRGTMREKAEQLKKNLSVLPSDSLSIIGLLEDLNGDALDIEIKMQKEEFDKLVTPLVEKGIKICRDLISDLGLEPELIDHYILVGGSSCIPIVQVKMKEAFGEEKVLVHPRPMFAIAEGAAILSHQLTDTIECPNCGQVIAQSVNICPSCSFEIKKVDIVPRLPQDFYIKLEDNPKYVLAEKGTELPFQTEEMFKTVEDKQRLIRLQFFNDVNNKAEYIGSLWLTLEQDYPPETEILLKIYIALDENIMIEATLKKNPGISVSKNFSHGKADEKILKQLEDMIKDINSEASDYQVANVERFKKQAIQLIKMVHTLIEKESEQVNHKVFGECQQLVDKMKTDLKKEIFDTNFIGFMIDLVEKLYGRILPDREKGKLDEFKKQIPKAGDDEKKIQQIHDNFWDWLLRDVGLIWVLLNIKIAEMLTQKKNQSLSSTFGVRHDQIIKAIQDGNMNEVNELIDSIEQDVQSVLGVELKKAKITIKTGTKK